jgi:hypothetical protein
MPGNNALVSSATVKASLKILVCNSFCLFAALAPALIPTASGNELALKEQAKLAGAVEVQIREPIVLNNYTVAQLYRIRSDAVMRQKNLLADTYEPSDSIFGQCEDNKPWWGIWGMYIFREGLKAPEGPSKESMQILNPFRLIAAEANSVGMLNPSKITDADMRNPKFPFLWQSGPVRFNPRTAAAAVTYNVTGFNENLKVWQNKLKVNVFVSGFALIAYNARDFGFNYIYLDPQKSVNMRKWAVSHPVQISQFLHCGGSCGVPGGCNNMSPFMRELDDNKFTKLPARAFIKLWKSEPDSARQEPDFTYVIDFR